MAALVFGLATSVFANQIYAQSPASVAHAWTIDSANSSVKFIAIGSPGFLRITGEGAKILGSANSTIVPGQPENVTGTFEVALGDLKTGMSLRDKHMKEKYLETEKFPKAILVIESLALPAPGSSRATIQFKGQMTIKGVEKPVSGEANVTRQADGIAIEANFALNLNDYPVGVPSWLGVSVAEKVDVTVTFSARGSTAH